VTSGNFLRPFANVNLRDDVGFGMSCCLLEKVLELNSMDSKVVIVASSISTLL
jgi:hypothetical protein